MGQIGQKPLTRLDKLTKYGYFTDQNVFSTEHLLRLRRAIGRVMSEVKPDSDTAAQAYWLNIVEQDESFAEVMEIRPVLDAMLEVIGPDVQLYEASLVVSKPTGNSCGWHRDKMSIGRHCPNMFVKICLYTEPTAIDGGPTGVVPESHLDAYKGEEFYHQKIDFVCEPGAMLAFGANTMHRAGVHAHARPQRPCLMYTFIPWWMKTAHYATHSRCKHLIESANPMRLQLLGVKMREGINMDLHTS